MNFNSLYIKVIRITEIEYLEEENLSMIQADPISRYIQSEKLQTNESLFNDHQYVPLTNEERKEIGEEIRKKYFNC